MTSPFSLKIALFVLVVSGYASAAHAQKAEVEIFESLAEMAKYAAEAAKVASAAADSLPKVIDDADSYERARRVLIASATNLPKAPFLQISSSGAHRLYLLENNNEVKAVNGISLNEVLTSANLRGQKAVIVDAASAAAHRPEFLHRVEIRLVHRLRCRTGTTNVVSN